MGLRIVLASLAVFLFLAAAGCGMFGDGGDEDEEAIKMLTWDDEESPAGSVVSPVTAQVPDVGVPGVVVEELRFLYGYQVSLEAVQQLIRDLTLHFENGGEGPEVGLDWVIGVHDLIRESDEVLALFVSHPVPERQRARYGDMYVGGLDLVQVTSFGADRLLAAALVLGPSGRDLSGMSREEANTYHTYLRESGFFLRDAQRLADQHITEVGQAVGQVDYDR